MAFMSVSLTLQRSLSVLRQAGTALSSYQRGIYASSPAQRLFIIKNNEDFETRVMKSADPVIVNFHAEWCEPCKILTPRLTELLTSMDNVHLAVIDVEKNVELVHTFEVKAVPAVLAIRNGQVEDKFIGLVDADMIDSLIRKLVGDGAPPEESSSADGKK